MPESFHILLIVGSLNQGGAEFQLLSLANLLQSKGHDVEVLALTDYDYFLPYIKEQGLKYSCVANNGSNFKKTLRAVKAINDKKPDLVISYIKKVSQVAIAARVISGFRFKLIISERTSLVKPCHDLFYFNIALLANKITVNSISKINYIKSHFPLLKRRTFFIPNIVDITKYEYIRYSRIPVFTRISFVGRLSPEKNLLHLIRAVDVLVKKGYALQLSMVGALTNNIYVNQLYQLIDLLQLGSIITIRSSVKDVVEVYKQTDLLCLVSIFEGFSNVLSEAICCGIPVVASNIDENRYLVEDGVNGFLADPGSYESIAAGIENFLLLSEAQKATISANNKAKAKELFDEEKVYQQYLDIFKQIGVS